MKSSRRQFLTACSAAGATAMLAPALAEPKSAACRRFHLSISLDALRADPELLEMVSHAGVTDLWIAGFLYGHWYYPLEQAVEWRRRAEKHGLAAHVINVPLGHPGDSLGAKSGNVPLTPPRHWKLATGADGRTYSGTSLHPPATEENCQAMRQIQAAGFRRVFLDDDFRLARSPGMIGGCFCPEHRQQFLRRAGYAESHWRDLLDAVGRRDLTPVLRAWIEFTCDQLTACFRAQQKAAPNVQLGTMVMYFGAEKAGIRLTDYRDVPLRVGELMFDDASFSRVKGKTDELFGSLFHRRYVRPELAYSETTAFPANRLSAGNMAAKLAISTISDVRNTMYMSGLSAFPRDHWQTLGPAMKRHAELHRRIAGHAARGPLKHFWGEASRYVGDDNPYSMFLALGIPFEVTSELASDGFIFLSDADARAAGGLRSEAVRIARPGADLASNVRAVPESLPELFALKREIIPKLNGTPYVEGEVPLVCAWYPTARAVLLWNLTERREDVVLCYRGLRRTVGVEGLDTVLIDVG